MKRTRDSMLPPRCHGEPETLLWQRFLEAGCPSCHHINSIKTMKTVVFVDRLIIILIVINVIFEGG